MPTTARDHEQYAEPVSWIGSVRSESSVEPVPPIAHDFGVTSSTYLARLTPSIRTRRLFALAAAWVGIVAGGGRILLGQASSIPANPTALGEEFESRVAGVAFSPPAGGTRIRQTNGDYLVRYAYPDRGWDLRVKVTTLTKPVPLSRASSGPDPGGMLEMTADAMKSDNPSTDVLEQTVRDDVPSPDGRTRPVGFIAARANVGTDRALSQTAVFRGSDQTYYTFQLTSPGRKKTDAGAAASATLNATASANAASANAAPAGDDPAEVAAAAAFDAVLSSVRLLDRESLRREQDQRLFHTRAFYDLLDRPAILRVLVPDQYLKIIHDGRDAGFIHVTETPTTVGNDDGVEIVLRSRVMLEPDPVQATDPSAGNASTASAAKAAGTPGDASSAGELLPSQVSGVTPPPAGASGSTGPTAPAVPAQVDRLSKQFVSFDRRHEEWTTVTQTTPARTPGATSGMPAGSETTSNAGATLARPVQTTEMGNSDNVVTRMLDHAAMKRGLSGDAKGLDPKNPPVKQVNHYTLSVSNYARVRTGVPVDRELPPYYLPQALAYLLPTLLPRDTPQGFLFAFYVNDEHEVMFRYLDVLPEQDITLDGRTTRAIAIRDRIGSDGSATVHYVTPDGHWLGSVNQDQKLLVIPADADEVKREWKGG